MLLFCFCASYRNAVNGSMSFYTWRWNTKNSAFLSEYKWKTFSLFCFKQLPGWLLSCKNIDEASNESSEQSDQFAVLLRDSTGSCPPELTIWTIQLNHVTRLLVFFFYISICTYSTIMSHSQDFRRTLILLVGWLKGKICKTKRQTNVHGEIDNAVCGRVLSRFADFSFS